MLHEYCQNYLLIPRTLPFPDDMSCAWIWVGHVKQSLLVTILLVSLCTVLSFSGRLTKLLGSSFVKCCFDFQSSVILATHAGWLVGWFSFVSISTVSRQHSISIRSKVGIVIRSSPIEWVDVGRGTYEQSKLNEWQYWSKYVSSKAKVERKLL